MPKLRLLKTNISTLILAILCIFGLLSKSVTSEYSIGINFDSTPDVTSLIRGGKEHRLVDGKPNSDAITVTKFVYVNDPMETETAQLGMCPTISQYTPRHANPSGIQREYTERSSYSIWSFALFKPIYLTKTVTVVLFTYLFRPIFFAAIWAIRVLVFRPAIFIYLLFLERPFHALLSFVLWILPMLAFITAITLVAIVIGGTFGWFSAVAVGAINATSPVDTHSYTDDKDTHHISLAASIPQRVELVFSDAQGDFSNRQIANPTMIQQQKQPDIWTRRKSAAVSKLD